MMYDDWPSFDELRKMAEQSPEKLEEFRNREVEALIASAPEDMQRRLKGLQFQVDCQRRLHKTPLASCIAVSKMMHESLAKLNAVLNGKSHPEPYVEQEENNVVPFAG